MSVDDEGDLRCVANNDPRVHVYRSDGSYAVVGEPPGYGPARLTGQVHATFGHDGRAYVVERGSGRLRRYAPDGTFELDIDLTASEGGAGDQVHGLAVDVVGRIYLTGTSFIQRLSPEGRLEKHWPAVGMRPLPDAIATGHANRVYVADASRRSVECYSTDGEHLGVVLGPEPDGAQRRIVAISVDPDGRLAIADDAEGAVILVSADGSIQTVTRSAFGVKSGGELSAVTFLSKSELLVALKEEARVVRVTLQ
jgi:hypothetical protein